MINADELPPELAQQFIMFELMVDQMTDAALRGFIGFLTEKLEKRHAS